MKRCCRRTPLFEDNSQDIYRVSQILDYILYLLLLCSLILSEGRKFFMIFKKNRNKKINVDMYCEAIYTPENTSFALLPWTENWELIGLVLSENDIKKAVIAWKVIRKSAKSIIEK